MRGKTSNADSDRGLSSVVGVILMIVVTVILAAVVLNFTLGLGSYLQEPPQAGVTITETVNNASNPNNPTYDVSITVSSMPHADKVTIKGPVVERELNEVGSHIQLTGLEKGERVIVTASYESQTVVIQENVIGS